MFIFEFLGDANFGIVSFTMLVYSTINYLTKRDHFKMWDRDMLIGFESILQHYYLDIYEDSWKV